MGLLLWLDLVSIVRDVIQKLGRLTQVGDVGSGFVHRLQRP
jgi:hypothetical protein